MLLIGWQFTESCSCSSKTPHRCGIESVTQNLSRVSGSLVSWKCSITAVDQLSVIKGKVATQRISRAHKVRAPLGIGWAVLLLWPSNKPWEPSSESHNIARSSKRVSGNSKAKSWGKQEFRTPLHPTRLMIVRPHSLGDQTAKKRQLRLTTRKRSSETHYARTDSRPRIYLNNDPSTFHRQLRSSHRDIKSGLETTLWRTCWSATCECAGWLLHRRWSLWSECPAPHLPESQAVNASVWYVWLSDPCWHCLQVQEPRQSGTPE